MTAHKERYARFAWEYALDAATARLMQLPGDAATYAAVSHACADEAARPAPTSPDADECPATLRTGGMMIAKG